MRKSAIIFFLTCSLILILGHSFFPHNHRDGATCAHCISLKKNISLAEIIKGALSQDLGTNHLEEYNNCDELNFTFSSNSQLISVLNPEDDVIDVFTPGLFVERYYIDRIKSQTFITTSGLRGPPSRI